MDGLIGLVPSEIFKLDELNDEDKKRHRLGSNNFSAPRSNTGGNSAPSEEANPNLRDHSAFFLTSACPLALF